MIDNIYDLTIKDSKMMVEDFFDANLISIEAHNILKTHIESLNIKVGDMVEFKDNDKNIKYRHNMINDLYRYDGISIVEDFKKLNTLEEYQRELASKNESITSNLFNKVNVKRMRRLDDIINEFFPMYRISVRPVGKHILTRLRTKYVDKCEDGKFLALKDPVYDEISKVDEFYSHLDTGIQFDSLILTTLTKDIDFQ